MDVAVERSAADGLRRGSDARCDLSRAGAGAGPGPVRPRSAPAAGGVHPRRAESAARLGARPLGLAEGAPGARVGSGLLAPRLAQVADKGPSASLPPSAARSWLFELRGE